MVPVKQMKKPWGKVVERTVSSEELVVVCPSCKAIQTVWFTGDKMMQTRKFRQEDGYVYHDCGSTLPCRIYKG